MGESLFQPMLVLNIIGSAIVQLALLDGMGDNLTVAKIAGKCILVGYTISLPFHSRIRRFIRSFSALLQKTNKSPIKKK